MNGDAWFWGGVILVVCVAVAAYIIYRDRSGRPPSAGGPDGTT